MKMHLSKKLPFRSILSIGLLGLFLLIAVGSDFIPLLLHPMDEAIREYNEKGKEYTYSYSNRYQTLERVYVGQQGAHGYWQGEVRITSTYQERISGEKITGVEMVPMVNGLRHGVSRMDYPGEEMSLRYYIQGRVVSKANFDSWFRDEWRWSDDDDTYSKALKKGSSSSIPSAYQWLSERYPWLVFAVEFTGYDSVYQENYLDTLELILQANTFDPEEFDDYYDIAIEQLEETPYDSMIQVNSFFTYLQGINALRGNELRLAVLDRYYNQSGTTYDIVADMYPGYLETMVVEAEVPEPDFAVFCEKLDSTMNSYGTLDLEDPFFVDSVDAHMYRAIMEILDSGEASEKKAAGIRQTIRSGDLTEIQDLYGMVSQAQNLKSSQSTPPDVAEVALYLIVMEYMGGDLMKEAVHTSWLAQNGIALPPTVFTSFFSYNSATSVSLVGCVYSDGGAEVGARGMAFSNHYNPTMADQSVTAGGDTGFFEVNLTGLTEGESYYARAYATNTEGTSYGNCIEFTVKNTVGMDLEETEGTALGIYPNPASSVAWLQYPLAASGNCRVQIMDMGGSVLRDMEMGRIETGEQQLQLDLSGIQDGSYICRLTLESGETYSARLLIAQ